MRVLRSLLAQYLTISLIITEKSLTKLRCSFSKISSLHSFSSTSTNGRMPGNSKGNLTGASYMNEHSFRGRYFSLHSIALFSNMGSCLSTSTSSLSSSDHLAVLDEISILAKYLCSNFTSASFSRALKSWVIFIELACLYLFRKARKRSYLELGTRRFGTYRANAGWASIVAEMESMHWKPSLFNILMRARYVSSLICV